MVENQKQKCNNTLEHAIHKTFMNHIELLRNQCFPYLFPLVGCSEFAIRKISTMQRNIVHKPRQGRVLGSLCIGQGRLLAGGEKFRHNFQITFVL